MILRGGVVLGDHPVSDVGALPVASDATAFAGENRGG